MNASMPHNTSATKHTNKHVPISVTQHLEHKSLDIKKYHGLTSASIQYQYSIDTVSIQYQYVLILLTYVNHVKIQGTVHDVLRNAWVVKAILPHDSGVASRDHPLSASGHGPKHPCNVVKKFINHPQKHHQWVVYGGINHQTWGGL
jgi:hypothetical protein